MKWWFYICLKILVFLGTCIIIYFFPKDGFAKGLTGFVILFSIEYIERIKKGD